MLTRLKTTDQAKFLEIVECLALSVRVTDSTDLPSNSNILKTVKVNVTINDIFLKKIFDKLSNVTLVCRLCTCGSLVIDV